MYMSLKIRLKIDGTGILKRHVIEFHCFNAGYDVRFHLLRGERSILYKGVETSP